MITLHKTNISHQTGKGKSSSKGALRGEYLSSQEGNFIQFQPAEVSIPRTTHQPNGLCIKHIVNSKIKLYYQPQLVDWISEPATLSSTRHLSVAREGKSEGCWDTMSKVHIRAPIGWYVLSIQLGLTVQL